MNVAFLMRSSANFTNLKYMIGMKWLSGNILMISNMRFTRFKEVVSDYQFWGLIHPEFPKSRNASDRNLSASPLAQASLQES